MSGEPILRNLNAIGETRSDHPPTDGALQSTEAENEPQSAAQSRSNPAAPEEPHERQQKNYADQAADEPVRPFPPIDRLERVKAHALIERVILRDGLILFERALPLRFAERRQYAHDRLPLGDRQARFRQPRCTANQNHGEHQGGDGIKPQPYHAGMNIARGSRQHDLSFVIAKSYWPSRVVSAKSCRLSCLGGADHIVLPLPSQPTRKFHACPPAQIHRRRSLADTRHRVGTGGNGVGAIAVHLRQYVRVDCVLRHRRNWLGIAGNADCVVDVAA